MASLKNSYLYRILERQTCKGHARLLSRALDHRLSFFERLNLRIHSLLCRPCYRYGNQLRMLERARREAWSGEQPDSPGLSNQARDRINHHLSEVHGLN